MELTGLIFAALSSAKKANKRIDTLPLPMVFKGTLGTGGTIETLPTASSENEGFVYIVITNGTYAGQTAKAGDLFISDGSSWVLVPSADDNFVIDDTVISNVLTWSSDKINKECNIKTFTYTGNGETTNTIHFPITPKMILDIQRSTSTNTFALTTNIVWNQSMFALMTLANTSTSTVVSYGIECSFNNNDLVLNGSSDGRVFNTNGQTFTVYYI